MERDEAKFPPEPYYPWLVLPWNVKDEDEEDEDYDQKWPRGDSNAQTNSQCSTVYYKT